MYRSENDTLATITTPIGEGGIGVIQVSGPGALDVVDRVFRGKNGRGISGASSGELFYGTVVDSATSALIDEAIVCVWRSEDSFTGEDLVEVNCHGGPRAVKKTLDAIIGAGASVASWTDFLARGLKNDRMDIIQIEAQEALIQAKTRLSVRVLLAQHQGLLSQRVSRLEAEIDRITDKNAGDRIGGLAYGEVSNKLAQLLNGFDELLDSSAFGLALSSPQKVSITGPPNVGKSTLFNTLLGEERTIVHHVPGTTRDYISEYFSAQGIPFELVDSAGLRDTHDHIERKGIERAHAIHKHVDKIILVLDGSKEISEKEWTLIRNLDTSKVTPVINKIDLDVVLDTGVLEAMFDNPICRISALKGLGLESLEKTLVSEFQPYIDCYNANRQPRPVVFTERQLSVLSRARGVAGEVLEALTH
ncbi:MAG: GTPase, partial [Candidatus Brocadiales bacterium]